MQKILSEDDSGAPDSRPVFWEKFQKIVGISIEEFKAIQHPLLSEDEMVMRWKFGDYLLEISADDPFYRLFKK